MFSVGYFRWHFSLISWEVGKAGGGSRGGVGAKRGVWSITMPTVSKQSYWGTRLFHDGQWLYECDRRADRRNRHHLAWLFATCKRAGDCSAWIGLNSCMRLLHGRFRQAVCTISPPPPPPPPGRVLPHAMPSFALSFFRYIYFLSVHLFFVHRNRSLLRGSQ